MSSFELFIVFAALIALVALVAIAIDWVGRPLKTKRFIPRIYRFEDEIYHEEPMAGLAQVDPVAGYGTVGAGPQVAQAPVPYSHPPIAPYATPGAPPTPDAPPKPPEVVPPSKPARPTVVATVHEEQAPLTDALGSDPKPTRSSSVFSDEISDDADEDPEQSRIASTEPVAAPTSWQPGDPLDARQNDRKPTTALKAQRFWQTIAATLEADSHFDDAARSRMADGRAPRRRNPRTGSTETASLVGLRSAASADEVRMYWPDDSVDPWSAS